MKSLVIVFVILAFYRHSIAADAVRYECFDRGDAFVQWEVFFDTQSDTSIKLNGGKIRVWFDGEGAEFEPEHTLVDISRPVIYASREDGQFVKVDARDSVLIDGVVTSFTGLMEFRLKGSKGKELKVFPARRVACKLLSNTKRFSNRTEHWSYLLGAFDDLTRSQHKRY